VLSRAWRSSADSADLRLMYVAPAAPPLPGRSAHRRTLAQDPAADRAERAGKPEGTAEDVDSAQVGGGHAARAEADEG